MPQLDVTTFSPQLFWLAISFIVLLVLMSRLVLPRVGKVLGQREERIGGNLEKAEKLKAEADAVLAAYHKAMADARAQAQAALTAAGAEIAATAAAREGEFAKKLAEQTAAAEARIKASKTEALAEVRNVAADLAAAMTSKLTGIAVGSGDTATTIDAVLKERN
ncbi:MAG TPA: F0F1 ATP synthase subunit B' [Dongiaceae bacterium]|nr:F0F1 ATP synthase subunit B' [Dongiaceae bacterium]